MMGDEQDQGKAMTYYHRRFLLTVHIPSNKAE